MVQPDQSSNPVDLLAAEINRMRQRLDSLDRWGMKLPVLDADPDPGDPTNLWMLNDGRLRGRDAEGRVREWAATTPGSSATSDLKPVVPNPHLHQVTYLSTNSQDYCPVHGKEDPLEFGQRDATHGERLVMMFLPDTTIRSDLTGATVRTVELQASTQDANYDSGVDIAWGAHNEAVEPATYKQNYENVWADHWPKVGGNDWRTMPNWFGTALRDNTIKGLVINQPSSSLVYAGRLDPVLSLRITYSHAH